jgi:hypothetical protein
MAHCCSPGRTVLFSLPINNELAWSPWLGSGEFLLTFLLPSQTYPCIPLPLAQRFAPILLLDIFLTPYTV